jgi:hypothetical protein
MEALILFRRYRCAGHTLKHAARLAALQIEILKLQRKM